jgi:hypothetical protein
MKPLVAMKVLLVFGSFAAWSNPAVAQNAGLQTGKGIGSASSPGSKPGRSPQQVSGKFQSVCITERGLRCNVISGVPILPDSICHCGPSVGATLSPSQP